MIFFKLTVDNPWYKPKTPNNSKDLFYREGSFTQHKHWEVQCTKWGADDLAVFELDLRWRGRDHAGPEIHVELFGYMFSAKIYDSRHWNYDQARWYLPDEQSD
jgi:hypothetical protein